MILHIYEKLRNFRQNQNASSISFFILTLVGQEPGDYVHRPSSGLENGNPSIPDFYRPDELKYHGKKNRGKVEMNFYDEIKRSIGDNAGATLDFCGGEWKYPRTCNPAEKTCEYFARWVFDENTDMIDFTIQSKHTDRWTGIGFSDTPQMVRRGRGKCAIFSKRVL